MRSGLHFAAISSTQARSFLLRDGLVGTVIATVILTSLIAVRLAAIRFAGSRQEQGFARRGLHPPAGSILKAIRVRRCPWRMAAAKCPSYSPGALDAVERPDHQGTTTTITQRSVPLYGSNP